MQNYIIFFSLLLCFYEFEQSKADPSGLNNFIGTRDNVRVKRYAVVGGLKDEDPKDPKYLDLAKESLKKYATVNGDGRNLEVSRVEKVTTQLVAGTSTRINFVAKPAGESEFNCYSEIWEKPWENFKQIDVTCQTGIRQVKKRSVFGGEEEQDPNDEKYLALAKESLKQYTIDSGDGRSLQVSRVEKVTTQLVAGILTKIYFAAKSADQTDVECFSKIWEKSWENFKEINATCEMDKKLKKRRSVPGGEEEQDPKDEKYLALAKESLQKYIIDSGDGRNLEVSQIERVTTQEVAGLVTKINFAAKSADQSDVKCFSKIWEKPWENIKEIDATCETDKKLKKRRSVPGGEEEQDPKEQKYLALAKESLNKYIIDSGDTRNLEVSRVEKVTTQTVAGLLTKISFVAKPANESEFKCLSKIWEKAWENFKDINVSCETDKKNN